MKLPDEFGTFPFARFTAEEFRYFFAWCARHRVSDIDLTGGSPVSVSRFGRRVRSSAHPLPSSIMMALSDELFGREVLPGCCPVIPWTVPFRSAVMPPVATVCNGGSVFACAVT